MTNREKLEAIRSAQQYKDDLEPLFEDIIKNTSNSECYQVASFFVYEDSVRVVYWYGYNRASLKTFADIPIVWLNEGFDYITDYKKRERIENAKRKKAEAARRRAAILEKKKQEYKMYLKLKAKYGTKEPCHEP